MWNKILVPLVTLLIGLLGGWLIADHYYRKGRDEEITRFAVAAMLQQCPVKDSRELDTRFDAYLAALKKTKAGGVARGTPVWRADCTISIDWSITVTDRIQFRE